MYFCDLEIRSRMNINSSNTDTTPWELRGKLPVVLYKAKVPMGPRLPMCKPFIASEDRFSHVHAGRLEITVNMHSVLLTAGQAIYTAEGSIVEITGWSDTLELYSCELNVKPLYSIHPHHRVFDADQAQRQRLGHYFDLLFSLTDRYPKVAHQVQQALLTDVFTAGHVVDVMRTNTRQLALYNAFLELVAENATSQRSVDFYAESLHVSPSRLMACIKNVSGRTVMQWINLRTLQQAKALLSYSDKTVAEIGIELGIDDPNYFSRFFRRETGMSPSEYRGSNA